MNRVVIISLTTNNKYIAGLGVDGDSGDPSNAEAAAAPPNGAVWREENGGVDLRRLQGKIAAPIVREAVHARGGEAGRVHNARNAV